jgi:hypothetical protein
MAKKIKHSGIPTPPLKKTPLTRTKRTLCFQLELPESKENVTIRIEKIKDTVRRKVYVDHKLYRFPTGPNRGRIMEVQVPVDAVTVELKRASGDAIKTRACCKPPDQFSPMIGRRLAGKRLVQNPSLHNLSRTDKVAILHHIAPDEAVIRVIEGMSYERRKMLPPSVLALIRKQLHTKLTPTLPPPTGDSAPSE